MKLIEGQPGISASDVAKQMKIKPNYLYRVLGDLEKEGRVKKDGRQYYPARLSRYHRYFNERGRLICRPLCFRASLNWSRRI